jgi:hypothetical protein
MSWRECGAVLADSATSNRPVVYGRFEFGAKENSPTIQVGERRRKDLDLRSPLSGVTLHLSSPLPI